MELKDKIYLGILIVLFFAFFMKLCSLRNTLEMYETKVNAYDCIQKCLQNK